jgi:hypothetical protein
MADGAVGFGPHGVDPIQALGLRVAARRTKTVEFREALFNELAPLPSDWPDARNDDAAKGEPLSRGTARAILLAFEDEGLRARKGRRPGIDAVWKRVRKRASCIGEKQRWNPSRYQVEYVLRHLNDDCPECRYAAIQEQAREADRHVLRREASAPRPGAGRPQARPGRLPPSQLPRSSRRCIPPRWRSNHRAATRGCPAASSRDAWAACPVTLQRVGRTALDSRLSTI